MQASVTPYVDANAPPMLLIYADGDDDWRRAQNERLVAALRAAGHEAVRAEQVPNRDHVRLMTQLNSADDEIGGLMARFAQPFGERADYPEPAPVRIP